MSTAMLGTVPIYDALGYYDKDLKILQQRFLEVVESMGKMRWICYYSCWAK